MSLKIIRCLLPGLCILLLGIKTHSQQHPMLMWFDRPAHQPEVFSYQSQEFTNSFHFEKKGWFEALPVGNGRMGAMVFGGVASERIQLNEESLWDGYQHNTSNPLSAQNLEKVQQLMFAGKNDSSELLASNTMMGIPITIKPYQSLGDLFIEQLDVPEDAPYTRYRRWLSLDSAVVVTRFVKNGIQFRREVFASHPENIIVIRIVSAGNEVSATVEHTGGYYAFKTRVVGRIHLQANSCGNLEMQAVKLKSGSLMNLKLVRLIPVPKQVKI